MDEYDWSEFTVHTIYRASRADVFRAWATPAGLASFFIGAALHTGPDGAPRDPHELAQVGDRYAWDFVHGFRLTGEILAVDPGERVAFTFGGDLRVEVTLRQLDGGVQVRLHQTGCATEDPDRPWQHVNCRSCWIFFMTNLVSVLEHGTDLRDHEHPAWNDAVSIGWRGESDE
jgi:uncharacterized protein YndB with AHSA1/START domain